ncbi:MAG: outer membrane lipoprotein carrier protein LolA [Saprospiraceae bacterium]|nr:outer membrane lipoprotein carrier protein LolA [Saprospiraceae bacterium]
MEVNFELVLELKGQAQEVQKGKLIQQGDSYMVSLADQEVYSDGKTVWIYLKSNKEVQINSAETGSEGQMASPKEMLRIYESGKYAYAITGNIQENGTNVTQIEFKPLDKNSEYSKIRLSVNEKAKRATSIKVFGKDGSRYTLFIKNIQPNKAYPQETFVFNAKKYPGVRVEDLRID